MKPDDLKNSSKIKGINGHFVALMISEEIPGLLWPGDYHWCRSSNNEQSSWSQKDGSEAVTNFDFKGSPITDPRNAIGKST